jgi:hypothetical protein
MEMTPQVMTDDEITLTIYVRIVGVKLLSVSGNDKIISALDPKLYPDISFLTSKITLNDKSCPEIRYFYSC